MSPPDHMVQDAVAIYWAIDGVCRPDVGDEVVPTALARIRHFVDALFAELRHNTIRLPSQQLYVSSVGSWNKRISSVVEAFGFRILQPKRRGKYAAEYQLLDAVNQRNWKSLPPTVVFASMQNIAHSLWRTVRRVRLDYGREVWVIGTADLSDSDLARTASRFVSQEDVLGRSAFLERESPETVDQTPVTRRPGRTRTFAPVGIYADLENLVNLRCSPSSVQTQTAELLRAVFRNLLSQKQQPLPPYLLACTQRFLPDAVRQLLEQHGFAVHLTNSSRRDAAEELLMREVAHVLDAYGEDAFPRHAVILSGDGRLSLLVQRLHRADCRVSVIGRRHHTSRVLEYMADEFLAVEDLLAPGTQ